MVMLIQITRVCIIFINSQKYEHCLRISRYPRHAAMYENILLQWILVTTTAFVPKDVAIKMNLLLYRILNELIDM